MDYQTIYVSLIERARHRIPDGYVERHHVVPICIGGTDTNENLVALYPEEHFFAHVLLVKIYPEHKGLINAVQLMEGEGKNKRWKGRRRRTMYGWLKRKHAAYMRESQSGQGNSQHGTMWISDLKNQVSKKWKKTETLPNGWVQGRNVWKKPEKKERSLKYDDEVAKKLLNDWESGVDLEIIKERYGMNSDQSVRGLLNRRFPDRKKFTPFARYASLV